MHQLNDTEYLMLTVDLARAMTIKICGGLTYNIMKNGELCFTDEAREVYDDVLDTVESILSKNMIYRKG